MRKLDIIQVHAYSYICLWFLSNITALTLGILIALELALSLSIRCCVLYIYYFLNLFLNAGWLLYNTLSVSATHQRESAVGMRTSPPSWTSLPPPTPAHSSKLSQSAGFELPALHSTGRSRGEGMATHSSIPAWKVSWTEEPGGLQSVGFQRVGHDWVTNTHTHPRGTILIKTSIGLLTPKSKQRYLQMLGNNSFANAS